MLEDLFTFFDQWDDDPPVRAKNQKEDFDKSRGERRVGYASFKLSIIQRPGYERLASGGSLSVTSDFNETKVTLLNTDTAAVKVINSTPTVGGGIKKMIQNVKQSKEIII